MSQPPDSNGAQGIDLQQGGRSCHSNDQGEARTVTPLPNQGPLERHQTCNGNCKVHVPQGEDGEIQVLCIPEIVEQTPPHDDSGAVSHCA
jgi:hypothetical protein